MSFRRLGDNDFDVKNLKLGRPAKKFEEFEPQTILNGDTTLSQKDMSDVLNVADNF